MRVVISHNALTGTSAPDEQDVMVQVAAVADALRQMGHAAEPLACGLNLALVSQVLDEFAPDLVFNLVEGLSGSGRMIHFFPGLLEAKALSYTGASADALFMTSNKLAAKSSLLAAGLPTPAWVEFRNGALWRSDVCSDPAGRANRWIVKSVWEHASIGLDETAIVAWPGSDAMLDLLLARAPGLGGSGFSEAFVEGREFNLSILETSRGPRVLPPAEILFSDFETGKQRIVDYRAKWDPESFEYHHTPRHFDFTTEDQPLLRELSELALACWRLFDLNGYARVDFRVDECRRPWILEVNANPCLSPDAGFAAAVARAGLTFDAAVAAIVDAALR